MNAAYEINANMALPTLGGNLPTLRVFDVSEFISAPRQGFRQSDG